MARKLRGKMLKAIVMIAEGYQVKQMEEALGIRPSTLAKWRRIPEFISRLEERKQAIAENRENAKRDLLSGLTQLCGESIKTHLMCNIDSPERLQNYLGVLKFAAASPKEAQTYTNMHKLAQSGLNLPQIGQNMPKKSLVKGDVS